MTGQEELHRHILELESHLLQPEVRRSRSRLAGLLADDFIEIGTSGRTFNKQDIIEAVTAAPSCCFTLDDFRTRLLSPEIILATYRAAKIETPGGPPRHSLRSSIWKLIDGKWQVIFHQGTSITVP